MPSTSIHSVLCHIFLSVEWALPPLPNPCTFSIVGKKSIRRIMKNAHACAKCSCWELFIWKFISIDNTILGNMGVTVEGRWCSYGSNKYGFAMLHSWSMFALELTISSYWKNVMSFKMILNICTTYCLTTYHQLSNTKYSWSWDEFSQDFDCSLGIWNWFELWLMVWPFLLFCHALLNSQCFHVPLVSLCLESSIKLFCFSYLVPSFAAAFI